MDYRRASIARILGQMRRMVESNRDGRATALAELKDTEEGDPFKILIGTILSHRTRDESTAKANKNLFGVYRTPEELARADPSKVRELIRPVGFYKVKTKNVIRAAQQIVNEFGGKVPRSIDELLKIHAVGRKTANCVLVYGFEIPAIPVDTHVHRISNRLGIVQTQTPEQTEIELTKKIPKRYWLEVNEMFVRFGQTICKPVGPRCDSCTLRACCKYYDEVVSKGTAKEEEEKGKG